MDTVDARGLSCPQPVLMTMEKMKEKSSGEFRVLVDTEASCENVTRIAQKEGWTVAVSGPEDEVYTLDMKK